MEPVQFKKATAAHTPGLQEDMQGSSRTYRLESEWPLPSTFPLSIDLLKTHDEDEIAGILQRNIDLFRENNANFNATNRRIQNLLHFYNQKGAAYFVLRDRVSRQLVGGAGIAPFAELPYSEKLGEIYDLVVDRPFQQKGYGSLLLTHNLNYAAKLGYRRVYLETMESMTQPRKLFRRCGFNPITEKKSRPEPTAKIIPSYYVLDLSNPS